MPWSMLQRHAWDHRAGFCVHKAASSEIVPWHKAATSGRIWDEMNSFSPVILEYTCTCTRIHTHTKCWCFGCRHGRDTLPAYLPPLSTEMDWLLFLPSLSSPARRVNAQKWRLFLPRSSGPAPQWTPNRCEQPWSLGIITTCSCKTVFFFTREWILVQLCTGNPSTAASLGARQTKWSLNLCSGLAWPNNGRLSCGTFPCLQNTKKLLRPSFNRLC